MATLLQPRRAIDAWIFDLDNTLYPASCNLFEQVHRRMGRFIEEELGLDEAAAYALQKRHFARYGTTMRGLMEENGVDPVAYMDYVHRVDLSGVPADPALDGALARLPGSKLIFTNGSVAHAERITRHLGIERHFGGIFDIAAAGWVPKPDPAAYAELLRRYGLVPGRTAMVEDMAKNLRPAATLGLMTVWITADPGRPELSWARDGSEGGWIDHTTDDLPRWLNGWGHAPPAGQPVAGLPVAGLPVDRRGGIGESPVAIGSDRPDGRPLAPSNQPERQ